MVLRLLKTKSAGPNCYIHKMSSSDEILRGVAANGSGRSTFPVARRQTLWLWVIVACGTGLRLIGLGYNSLWLDEIASIAIVRMPGHTFWLRLWHDEGNMALYYVLLRGWLHFGHSEVTVRVLSVLPGVAAIPLSYLLGSRLFSRRSGLLAATFLSTNICAIHLSQEARSYSFVVFGVLLSTYLFARFVEQPSSRLAVAYGLASAMTLYFHYFGILIPIAHALSIVTLPVNRRPWKQLLQAAVVFAVLATPVVWMIHIQSMEHLVWVKPPSFLELYHLGGYLAADSGKLVGGLLLALDLGLIVLFLGTFKKAWVTHKDGRESWHYGLLASTLFSPLVITLVAAVAKPVFYHRFLTICLPAWVLMTAVAAGNIKSRTRRALIVGTICLLSLIGMALSYSREREDWRGPVGYLVAQARSEDSILYYGPIGSYAIDAYRSLLTEDNGPRPRVIEVKDEDVQNRDFDLGTSPRLWLVLYRASPTDPTPVAIDSRLEARYRMEQSVSFRGVVVIEYVAR